MNLGKILTIGFVLLLGVSASAQKTWQECTGLIVMDAESVDNIGQWTLETQFPGYGGTGYLRWNGSDYMGKPSNKNILTYTITITNPGVYHLRWHARHENPDGSLENDHWVNVNGAGWHKTGNWTGTKQWTWQLWNEHIGLGNLDNQYTFSAGTVKIEMQPRSKGLAVDRFVLWKDGVDTAKAMNVSTPQTLTCSGTSILSSTVSSARPAFAVISNPLSAQIRINCPSNKAGKFTIYSAQGKVVRFFTTKGESILWSKEDVTGSRVNPGVYLGVFSSSTQNISNSFVVF